MYLFNVCIYLTYAHRVQEPVRKIREPQHEGRIDRAHNHILMFFIVAQ